MITPKSVWTQVRPWDRHGLILLIAGLTYILIGVAYMVSEDPYVDQDQLRLALYIAPYFVWYVGFIVVGVIAMVSSRWPSTTRPIGYAALTAWSTAWAGFHIIGGLSQPINVTYIVGGLMMGMLGFLWWAISALICLPNERGTRAELAAPYRCCDSCLDSSLVCHRNVESRYKSQS